MRLGIPERTTVEVELFGEIYHVIPVTKSVQAKAQAHEDKLDEAVQSMDDLVRYYGGGLDLRLSTTRPAQPKASKVVTDAWKADKITMPELQHVLDSIVESDRPT